MTSDHGYHLYDHGLWQKQSLFENVARVPLIIAFPGASVRGCSTASLAELVDLYPALADLCRLPPPEYLDGASLKPVLLDPSRTIKDAAYTRVRRRNYHGFSVRTARWRYVLWDDGRQGEQLFDMGADPSESNNLAGQPSYADTVKELRQRIREYAKNTP